MKSWLNDFVHNAIVHPLMCFMPIECGNRFHDWHATRAFGLDRYDEMTEEGRADDEITRLQAENEALRKDADRWREIRKGGDSVRVVFTDWDAMKDYVLSNEEADAAIDEAIAGGGHAGQEN